MQRVSELSKKSYIKKGSYPKSSEILSNRKKYFEKDGYDELEFLIQYSPTLEELGKFFGRTRERMRQVLKEKGLHEKWKKERIKRAENKKKMIKMLLDTIYLFGIKKYGIVFQKAAEYNCSRRSERNISFPQLIDLFDIYYKSKKYGETPSLYEISEKIGISAQSIGRILKKVGERPFHEGNFGHRFKDYEKEVIYRAANTETKLSHSDMSNILKRIYGIKCSANELSKRSNKKRNSCLKCMGYPEANISYTKALDLLDAVEAGFTKDEAKEYAGIKTDRAYYFILSHKDEIKEEIEKFIRSII
ncbi:MAG: hypothetical protein QXZ20_04145 [Candidatus Aenigmatarchaeota archaeon]